MSDNKPIHTNHRRRLRSRYEREGILSFEHHEMLELLLFSVIPRVNTNPTAHRLLNRFGSLSGVFNASYDEVVNVQGIGDRTARYLIDTAAEFYRECEVDILSSKLISFEGAVNLLMWHRRRVAREGKKPSAVSLIYLNEDFDILEVTDKDSLVAGDALVAAASLGADKLIISVDSEENAEDIKTLSENDTVKLCDVIVFSGDSIESVLN